MNLYYCIITDGERTRSLKNYWLVNLGKNRFKVGKIIHFDLFKIWINSIKTFEPKVTKQDLMKFRF
jgi:hypothetical protein